MPLRANNKNHTRIEVAFLINQEYAKNQDWECPLCKEKMSYVSEYYRGDSLVNAHFRHQSECSYDYDETIEHLMMKAHAAQLFTTQKYQEIRFEEPIGNRIADVIINRNINVYNPKKERNIPQRFPAWVIECENTTNGREIEARTIDYNKSNLPVLWFLNSQRLESIDERNNWPAKTTNYPERFINEINGGTVLYLSPEKPEIDKVHYSYTSRKWGQKRYLTQGKVEPDGINRQTYTMGKLHNNQKYYIVKLSPVKFGWWDNQQLSKTRY